MTKNQAPLLWPYNIIYRKCIAIYFLFFGLSSVKDSQNSMRRIMSINQTNNILFNSNSVLVPVSMKLYSFYYNII